MGVHVVNESGLQNVYRQSDCNSDTKIGTLSNGECFTIIGDTGYRNVKKIRFRNSSGTYATGFVEDSFNYGNLAFYGLSSTAGSAGSAYRFKLRRALSLVYSDGSPAVALFTGDYVWVKNATAGVSNPANMRICAYKQGTHAITVADRFVTLSFLKGSMIHSNFCLMKG